MRRLLSSFIKVWSSAAKHGIIIAVLDFLLLALAIYLGYAFRFSMAFPTIYITDCKRAGLIFPSLMLVLFALRGQYRILWTQASSDDYIIFAKLYISGFIAFLLLNFVWRFSLFPRSSLAVTFFSGILFSGGLRVSWRVLHTPSDKSEVKLKTLIVGAGEAGALLARDLMRNGGNLSVTAFVDDDKQKTGKRVSGLDVIGDTLHLAEIVKAEKFKVVLIAIPSALGEKIRAIYEQLAPLGVQVRLLPSLRELADGHVSVTRLRDIKLEDLLGRDPVKIDLDENSNYIKNKRVLITGAGGSIGSEIVRQVLRNKPSEIFVLGHGEQSIYLLLESLSELNLNIKVTPIIADVADSTAINNIFAKYKPELIFHAAAHKHVPLMEFSPREALRVNGIGTRTLARAAGKFKAERMVLISTDKAVNPSSVMGATKRVAEKVIEREQKNFPETLYMAVRFGNVLGSRGSVIPKFEKQIAAGGPVTVTAKGMKRYFMLIPEAVSLVIQAGAMGCGGDLFVLDMGEQVVITEMAELLIRLYGYEPYKDIAITFTGIRPGEKLEEELFYDPNKVHPTKHHKIFSSSFKSALDDENLNFNELLEQAVNEPDNALNLLHKLVPEFKKIN